MIINISYGEGCELIASKLSEMPDVRSVVSDGVLYQNGQGILNEGSPGAFTKLMRELNQMGAPYYGDLMVTVDERPSPGVGDKIVEALTGIGWQHIHTQHARGRMQFWLAKTADPRGLYQIIGTAFDGTGSQGKAGNKRDRVFSPINSPEEGSFVTPATSRVTKTTLPDGTQVKVCNLSLPDGESLQVLIVPAQGDANDGDALLSDKAVRTLACAAEIKRREWKELDQVQFQIRAEGHFLKALGQVESRVPFPPEFDGYDIVIGDAGVSTATSTSWTVGKITFHYQPRRDTGFRIADGLESVPNCLLKYYEPAALVQFGQMAAVKKLLDDQHRVMAAERQEVTSSDFFADDLPASHGRHQDDPDKTVWRLQQQRADEFAAWIREWTGSIYAHPVTLGNANLTANIVRGILKKASSTPDMGEGLPYAVLPAHYLNRAHHRFAGVPEPDFGWATIVFRDDGAPYLFVLNDGQVSDADDHLRHSTPDNDDHWLHTVGRDAETGQYYLVGPRQPNEPDGGSHYRITEEQAELWSKTRPVMPLRKGWGHRVPSLAELESNFSMGEGIETQAPTTDLAAITAYCRWATGEGKYVAEYANASQALFNSGASVAETYSCSSELLDNVWNQTHDGSVIVGQVHRKCVDYISEGRPWHRPSYVRVKRVVEDLYRELHGKDPSIRFGVYPHLEKLYNGVKNLDDMLSLEAAILNGFCNGPVPMLTQAANPAVAAIAAAVVEKAKAEWEAWGKRKAAIMRQYRLPYERREYLVTQETQRTLDRIEAHTLAGYDRSHKTDDYVPGQYAAALTQLALSHAPRWEPPDATGRYRVTKAQRLLPKRPYQLLQHLPEHELRAAYTAGETTPTWVSRIRWAKADNPLCEGEYLVIRKDDQGRWVAAADTTDEVLAYLDREAFAMDGMSVQYVGTVARYDSSGAVGTDFYQPAPLAVFRCRHKELADRVNTRRLQAHQAIAAQCKFRNPD